MKPRIPKGLRDFSPSEIYKRNFLFDTIKSVFIKFGFQPIETPTMEVLETLTGSYGEEGDKLLFKVLNNGDFLNKADKGSIEEGNSSKLAFSISKRGLRYDLTIPFARYVVQHQNEITFPFKRYQIQPVWRADRPQKGRYQEFYQCDVDVVGSYSLMYEAELVQIYQEVFKKLNLPVTIRISSRKILAGIAEVAGIPDQMVDMTVAMDKLDKIGVDGVMNELEGKGIPAEARAKITSFLDVKTIEELAVLFQDCAEGLEGCQELQQVFTYIGGQAGNENVLFDITLARGLSYYTGFICEVIANNVDMGSIGGGGRYDDLTSKFGLKNVPGVGVSFGAERIYDVMESLSLFPEGNQNQLKVLLIALDENAHLYGFKTLQALRDAEIIAEQYPEPAKMKKQMKYANDRQVPYVVILGDKEVSSKQYVLKNMETGDQSTIDLVALIQALS